MDVLFRILNSERWIASFVAMIFVALSEGGVVLTGVDPETIIAIYGILIAGLTGRDHGVLSIFSRE